MAGPGTMTESDGVADAASGIAEVQFSPPRELSQMYRIERQRTGDNFEVVASWGGDFGNTDSVTKNNKEFEKLKRDVSRLSRLLNHRDNAKKDEQLKHAHQQIEARDTGIRNLKRANVEHTPVPVRKPPPATMISNGGSKERKLAHLPSNREDPIMAPIPKLLESRHHTMNDIALSTSKSTGVKTACVQDGNINNDCSTTSNCFRYCYMASKGGMNVADVNITGAKRIKVRELREFSTFNSTMCGLYEVVVTITKIYDDEDNCLWYTGCDWCKTGLHEAANTQYWCRKCEKYYSEGHLRYLFKMEIADHTGSHDVTIADEVGEKLLGCKANFLSEMSKKERLRSITWNRYNIFLKVGDNNESKNSQERHDITVIHVTPLDPAAEAKHLLNAINNFT